MAKLSKKEYQFDDYINDFMIYCVNKELTKKTMRAYESSLKLFAKYLEEEHKIFSPVVVTTENIKEYLEFTKNKGKYSYVTDVNSTVMNNPTARRDFGKEVSLWTVNGYMRNIKVFYSFLFEMKVIKKNPCDKIKAYKHSRKPKSDIKNVDFNKLLKALDLSTFSEYRDYVVIQLIMDTGMRIGETLELKTDDVDMNRKAIYISADISKARKDRYVFFSNTMQSILKKWIDYRERYFNTDMLFVSSRGRSLNLSVFEKNLKKYCIRAKLEEHITPHMLRNNFAKRFLLSGGDIFILSKILGHSSVTVTEQAYLDVTNEDIRKSYYKFSPLENMKK